MDNKKSSFSRKRLFEDTQVKAEPTYVSKTLLNTGFQLFKDFTSAFSPLDSFAASQNAPPDQFSSPPSTPPSKLHDTDMPPTPTPNRTSPFPARSRKKLKMTPRPELDALSKREEEDLFLQDPYELHVNPPLMEIKVTPPSADNTPPNSPARGQQPSEDTKDEFFSQPLLPTPRCNINPFSPERPTQSKTPSRLSRIPQRPSNHSRYLEDFEELEEIGSGSFSTVYKCRNRIDGWLYAVKQAKRKFQSKGDKEKTLKEVYALAVLSSHPHVVRYYSAWVENSQLYIQTEYCGGGSLGDKRDSGVIFTEAQLCEALAQVAEGLRHIHSKKLAHLDVKPDNIYIQVNTDSNSSPHFWYKIGDLGLVSLADTNCRGDFDEGDSRYLSRDLLEATAFMQPQAEVLMKADIFALACSIYELALGKRLPSRGPEWNEIRDGKVELPSGYSTAFTELLKSMLHPLHELRPSAAELLKNPLLRSGHQIQLDDLHSRLEVVEEELNVEREKNRMLEKQLLELRTTIAERQTDFPQFEEFVSKLSRLTEQSVSEDRIADKVFAKLEGKLDTLFAVVPVKNKQPNSRRESE